MIRFFKYFGMIDKDNNPDETLWVFIGAMFLMIISITAVTLHHYGKL